MQCRCGQYIETRRFNTGAKTCLACGELDAQKEIAKKSKRIAPAYNKGGLVYMGSVDVAAQNLKNSSKNNYQGIEAFVTPDTTSPVRDTSKPIGSRRKVALGFFRLSGSLDNVFFYEEDDERLEKAIHVVRYANLRKTENGKATK
jgi:hypothetical protein